MNLIGYLESNLLRQLHWVQSADTRISLILPMSTVMLGSLSFVSPAVGEWTWIATVCSSFSVFFLILSIIFSAVAAFPRASGPKGSLIYFRDINNRKLSQYENSVNEMDENSYTEDLIRQCHVNAEIAYIKFLWVKRGMACLYVSALPWAMAIFLLYGLR